MPRSIKIEFSAKAVVDLDRLKAFIDIHNPKAAARAAKKILDGISKLRTFPLIGRPVTNIDFPPMRDLFIPFGQGGYWLRYTLIDRTITILRIWHGREDWG